MRETWHWFGEFAPIPLSQVAQTGAVGIVSALHAIPYGEVWRGGPANSDSVLRCIQH